MPKNITMSLSNSTIEIIEKLSKRQDVSKAGAVNQSIRLSEIVLDELHKGSKIYIEKDNGDTQELRLGFWYF